MDQIDKSYEAFLIFLKNMSKEELKNLIDSISKNSMVGEPAIDEYFVMVGEQFVTA